MQYKDITEGPSSGLQRTKNPFTTWDFAGGARTATDPLLFPIRFKTREDPFVWRAYGDTRFYLGRKAR